MKGNQNNRAREEDSKWVLSLRECSCSMWTRLKWTRLYVYLQHEHCWFNFFNNNNKKKWVEVNSTSSSNVLNVYNTQRIHYVTLQWKYFSHHTFCTQFYYTFNCHTNSTIQDIVHCTLYRDMHQKYVCVCVCACVH